MFIISSAIYAVLTIIFISLMIVYIYMCHVNNKYKSSCMVYKVDSGTSLAVVIIMVSTYAFLTAFCVGDLPSVWTNSLFLLCVGVAIFISVLMCGILKKHAEDKIRYAETFLADEKVIRKINECNAGIDKMQKEANQYHSGSDEYAVITESIASLKTMVKELNMIHVELQRQKIMLNAELGAESMNNVILRDEQSIRDNINKQREKIKAMKRLEDPMSDLRALMAKYNI